MRFFILAFFFALSAQAGAGLYTYVDDKGKLNAVDSKEQIPPKYRKKMKALQADKIKSDALPPPASTEALGTTPSALSAPASMNGNAEAAAPLALPSATPLPGRPTSPPIPVFANPVPTNAPQTK